MQTEAAMFTLLSTMILALLGGWFGSRLFPPILQRRRRNMHELP